MIVCVFVTGSKEHYRQGYLLGGVTMVQGVIRCGEHESGVQTPQNPIGRPGTNENRVRRKHFFLRYLDAGNINPGSKHLENPLANWEPMGIELDRNKVSLNNLDTMSMNPRPKHRKTRWSAGSLWQTSLQENPPILFSIGGITEVSDLLLM
jgi:hypothetical protein